MTFINRIRNLFSNTLVTLFICIMVIVAIHTYTSVVLVANVEDSLIEIAKQGAVTIEKDLERQLDVLKTTARIDLIKDTETPIDKKLDALNSYIKDGELLRISIADVDGNAKTTDYKELFVGDRDYFRRSINGESVISAPIRSRVDGNLIVVFSVPIRNGDTVSGVLYATYRIEELSKMTEDINLGSEGYSFIINGEGTTIAHKDREQVSSMDNKIKKIDREPELINIVDVEREMIRGKEGAEEYIYKGVKRLIGYAPIKGTDWSIAVTATKSQMFRRIDQVLVFLIISLIIISSSIIVMNLHNRQLSKNLKKEKAILINAIKTANIIIVRFDRNGIITDFNRYAEEKTGYKKDDVIKKLNIFSLLSEKDKNKIKSMIENFRIRGKTDYFEMSVKANAGGLVYVLWNFSGVFVGNDEVEIMGIDITERVMIERKLIASNEEISATNEKLSASQEELKEKFDELKKYQKNLHHLAYYDSLTDLPNRTLLNEKLSAIISEKRDRKFALFFIDSDNFKLVNDTLGHETGDRLIVQIGRRLSLLVHREDMVFRLGGDEFIFLMSDFEDINMVGEYADRIMEIFIEAFEVKGSILNISASMGISIYPYHGTTSDELLKNADIAMYKAKESGKSKFVIFDKSMDDEIAERMNLEKHLHKALKNNEFILYYQPQVDIKTGEISGFEALVRWNSPDIGIVPPFKFITIAEDSRLIIPLGEVILRNACLFIRKVQDFGWGGYTISVNISIIQLMQENFVDIVLKTIEETGINPETLELEITESVLMESFEIINKKLEVLNQKGVKIALDDFGKGYSSLSYLEQLSISTLKIDKSFIDSISGSKKGETLVGAIVSIGHNMGLNVVAEGVETQEQLEYLIVNGCDRFQGYLFSKPLPENEVIKILNMGSTII
ncbi:MAG: EAL domain-containing protein [Clostridia bacterium]|nr:EAL domain-containing protein [Clostridia bacterium]